VGRRLADEATRAEGLLAERQQSGREADEIKQQLEEDADREIEELKDKYEQK
jgi:cilia- and flagella-associated protein 57